MISKEVPAALFCEVLKNKTRTGIARNPPPIPNKPVMEPITREIKTKAQVDILFSGKLVIGDLSIEYAAPINTSEKPIKII